MNYNVDILLFIKLITTQDAYIDKLKLMRIENLIKNWYELQINLFL